MMNRQDFERLTTKYMDSVYRVLLHSCGNVEDAEDLLQETFLKLWNSEEHFDSDENVKRWLIRVAINASHSLWRKHRKRELSMEEVPVEPGVLQEHQIEIFDAIGKLPAKYREVIYLYYFEGYQTNEIAEILKKTESAVRSRLKRAREKLKEELGDHTVKGRREQTPLASHISRYPAEEHTEGENG